ncbi:SGNH/GDSL hydrolase family protein, partial [Akkermansiaceae bacterium]|nr:SGNH/GDSL hydrolase family protein [Akkermansiaceae bacterium]
EKYGENLTEMLKRCRKAKIEPVFCTLPPIDETAYFERHERERYDEAGGLEKVVASYRAVMLQVAKKKKVPVVDLNQLLVNTPEWQHRDGVHPSPKGNEIIAKLVAEVVGELIEE